MSLTLTDAGEVNRAGASVPRVGPGLLHCAALESSTSPTSPAAAPQVHQPLLAVNSVLGDLAGTYQAFGFEKFAYRYLAQVQYLFNRRHDLRAILVR